MIELAGGGKATLGEGPIWDARDGRLFWVDIVGSAINVLMPATAQIRRIEVGEHVGCLALTARPDTVSEDTLWCAFWDGAQVVGFDGNGEARETIAVPAIRPTSLTFGGPDLTTMFITSATFGLSERQLAEWPASGSVFELDRPTPGLPANVFAGEPWASRR